MVATFGLLLIIFGGVRSGRASAAPFAVGATFAGIKPSSMPPFVAAQLVGAGLAVLAIRVLHPNVSKLAADLPRARSVNFVPIFVRFARDGSGRSAQTEGGNVNDVPEVLFVCVHNAGRSQMASGFARAISRALT